MGSAGEMVLEDLLKDDRRTKERAPAFVEERDVTRLTLEERKEWVHQFDVATEKMEQIVAVARQQIETAPDDYARPPEIWIDTEVNATSDGGTEIGARVKAKGADGTARSITAATFSIEKRFPDSQDPAEQKRQERVTNFLVLTLGRGLVKIGNRIGVQTWSSDRQKAS